MSRIAEFVRRVHQAAAEAGVSVTRAAQSVAKFHVTVPLARNQPRRLLALAAVASLLLLFHASPGACGVLKTGTVADVGAGQVWCEVTNAGTSDVNVVRTSVFDFGGNERLQASSCPSVILPGTTCGFGADLPFPSGSEHAARCELEAEGDISDLRLVLHTKEVPGYAVRQTLAGRSDWDDRNTSTLSTGMVTDVGAGQVWCEITNTGTNDVNVVRSSVFDYGGNERQLASSCPSVISPGTTCGFGADLPLPAGYGHGARCEFETDTDIGDLRLVLHTKEVPGYIVRQTIEGRPDWGDRGTSTLSTGTVVDVGAGQVWCEVTNTGTSVVDIVRGSVFDYGGNERIQVSSCPATISPGTTCGFGADLPLPAGYGHGARCEFEAVGDISDLRLVLHTKEVPGYIVRQTLEGRPDWEDRTTSTLSTGTVVDVGAGQVWCEITNTGTSVVDIVRGSVFDYGGNERIQVSSCPATISPGTNCGFGADLPLPEGYGHSARCEFEAVGDIGDLRLVLHTKEVPGYVVRQTLEGRPDWAVLFEDGFESGDTSAWSVQTP